MTFDETLKKYVKETFVPPSSILYHYTNSAKEIISSKHLRMSSHEDLNKKNNREPIAGPKIIEENYRRLLPHHIKID